MVGGGGTHRHGHDNLILTTQYYGLKATQFFSTSSEVGAYQLKRDLEQLRFPSPKLQNIKFVSHGCMMAIWIDPNDHTRQCLHSAVHGLRRLYKSVDLERLSIKGFALQATPEGVPESLYHDILHVQSGSSSTAPPSNSPTVQTSHSPMRPRHALQAAKPGPSTLPPRPQSQAQTSNHALQGKPTSTAKRPAEVHDLNSIPSKRAKIDPLKRGLTTLPGNGVDTGSSSNPPSAMKRNAEPAMRKVAETSTTRAKSAGTAGSNKGQHSSLSQADIPKQITSSLASISLSNHTNATVSSLPQQVTPRSRPTPQSIPMPHRPVQKPTVMSSAEGTLLNPQPTNGANQPLQGSSTSHLNSTAPTMKEDQITELILLRRELKEKLDQELKLYGQIQEAGPASQQSYPNSKCIITRFQDIRQALKERDKGLEDAQKTVAAVERALANEQEKLKKSEEELQERRKVQVEIEGQFKSEQDKRIQLERDLSGERTKRMEVEEQLQKEGKLRIKAEDALTKNDVACQAMKAELDRSLALMESMRKEGESSRESLEMERANQVALQAKMKSDIEQKWAEESKRRAELEEELERERSLRLGAEATLKDVERECRAPFVVPALLEAFTTISNLTTQAMKADAPPT
ncbi:hypothetical protein JOM56_009718 [Amanita muscaria]